MARVLLTLRVFPLDVNVNIKNVKEKIREKLPVIESSEEPIAFGLTCLKLSLLIEDKEGEMEKMEKMIKEIEGVGEIEIIEMTRTL